jgi:hypothetical protein
MAKRWQKNWLNKNLDKLWQTNGINKIFVTPWLKFGKIKNW